MVDVHVDGRPVTVANTHLEAASDTIREAQARELVRRTAGPGPTVLVGDCNAAPSERAYDVLTGAFADAFVDRYPRSVGATCCRSPTLRDDRSPLDRRVDLVLHRGFRTEAVERVGKRPVRRGSDGTLWASDHAGVVATLTPLPATMCESVAEGGVEGEPSVDAAGPTPDALGEDDSAAAGFDSASAVLGLELGMLAWLAGRRREA